MKMENKTRESKLKDEGPPPATNQETNNNVNKNDEGEHFEIDIFRLIKVKSRRVNSKVIIAIVLVLLFVWLIVKW